MKRERERRSNEKRRLVAASLLLLRSQRYRIVIACIIYVYSVLSCDAEKSYANDDV